MSTKTELSSQILDFVRSLAPEPRKALRAGLHGLEKNAGDINILEGELAGWSRLRVKSYRVIFRYIIEKGQRIVRCEYAERRAVIYEMFAEQVRRQMEADDPER